MNPEISNKMLTVIHMIIIYFLNSKILQCITINNYQTEMIDPEKNVCYRGPFVTKPQQSVLNLARSNGFCK